VNAFHVIGAITALWAVCLAFLGLRNENFPGRVEKIVGAVSVLLVISAISAAIISSANEKDEHGGGAEEATKSESQ
jgi:Mn2+/Fe2+ NRAMP family transporter